METQKGQNLMYIRSIKEIMEKPPAKIVNKRLQQCKSLLTLNIVGFLILLCMANLQGGENRCNYNETEVEIPYWKKKKGRKKNHS